MASHTVIISLAIVVHDADERRSHEGTGTLVEAILHTVIRDRTSLDLIQSIVQETRESTEFEVHTTNTNDIEDPPHLPAYVDGTGTVMVTLVNDEQEALLATRERTTDRWGSPTHLTLARP